VSAVVLVTGGSRGIGRAIVERFLTGGASVVTCGRNEPDDLPDGAVFVTADVRDAEQVDALVGATVEKFGRLDVLVNNAGGSPPADAATASPRFITSVIALNLLGPFFCSQRANAVMQEQDEGGVIINIGSLSGLRPSPGTAAYGAAKAGVVSLTQTLAQEWAPKVRVNCVSGGLILTDEGRQFYGDDQRIERIAATVPLGRFGTPADVAAACAWLASPESAFVTGANLVVHGGGERPPFLDA
jgi:NAD(P)-dependent dehydrogenase (short-subunit alcohol dehydrogenase family)